LFYRQQQADLKPAIKMLKKAIQLEQTQVSAFKSEIITTITTKASLPQTSNNSQSKPTASSSISSSTSIRKKSIDDVNNVKSNTIINQLATNPLCPQDTKLFQPPTVQREVQRRHSSECGDIGGSLSKTHVQLSGVGINKLVPFRIPKKTSSQTTAGPTQNCKPGPYSSTSASNPAAPKRRRPSEISDLSKANNSSFPKPHQVKKTISIPATPLPEKVAKRRHSSYGNRRRGPRGDGNELGYSERKHNRHPHQTQRQKEFVAYVHGIPEMADDSDE
jgi:hypothetical protein